MNVEINRSKTLFTEQINNWDDWGNIFQSIPAFTSLVNHILKAKSLPASEIENLTPGTNAVFKTGRYVVKIYAPAESGIDQTLDMHTELFASARANRIGVSAPRLTAHGFVQDKYRFAYMITEYVEGVALADAVNAMSDAEKIEIGRRLRIVTDKMNTVCESFNGIDVELFDLDPVLLRGYFGNYTADSLTDLCFNGLLIHDFGGDIVAQHIGIPEEIPSINAMQERLLKMINKFSKHARI